MMSQKKSEPTDIDSEQQAIEQKVDDMMSVEPKSKPTKKATVRAAVTVAEDQTTAPQLPSQLLKTIGSSKAKSSLKIVKNEPEPEPETAPQAESAPTKPLQDGDPLEDSDTDAAVDSIVAEEADMQLAVADAVDRQKNADAQPSGPGLIHRFFTSPWTWLFIIGIAGVTYAWFH